MQISEVERRFLPVSKRLFGVGLPFFSNNNNNSNNKNNNNNNNK